MLFGGRSVYRALYHIFMALVLMLSLDYVYASDSPLRRENGNSTLIQGLLEEEVSGSS